MFLKYLAKIDLIQMLSKFSGQIGPKSKCFVQFNNLTVRTVLMESTLRVIGAILVDFKVLSSRLHRNS
jgi:hypothetical protein